MNSNALRLLWRRVLLVIGRGRIRVVDDSRPAQVLQVQLGATETKDGIPRAGEYGLASNPPLGTDAIVVFLAGERTNGVVIATNNQTFRMRNLASGEVAIHDNRGRFVLLGAAGIHVQGNAEPVFVETTGAITANAGGDIAAASSGGAIRMRAATEISLQAGTRVSIQAPDVSIQAGTTNITSDTVAVDAVTTLVGATTIDGVTAINGDTTITGTMTNNGHDVGQAHTHLPGTFKANTTNVTGTSGAVT